MPQFDVFLFFSSVFYLLFGFFSLMFYNQFMFLPKIAAFIKIREKISKVSFVRLKNHKSSEFIKLSEVL